MPIRPGINSNTSGGLTEPVTLTQLLTVSSNGITSSGPYISTVASGSQALEIVQGGRISFDGGTGSKYLTSSSTQAVLVGLGLSVPSPGIELTGVGTISGSGNTMTWNAAGGISTPRYFSTNAQATFTGNTTQTTASTPGCLLAGFASNQANQVGVDIGIQTTWSGVNSQKLIRFGYSITGASGTGTFPLMVMATGKLRHFNSASNAADVAGTATLVAGTVTVSTTAIEATDIVICFRNTTGGTLGNLSAPTASIVAGTSFVINSDNASDTSTVNWYLVGKA